MSDKKTSGEIKHSFWGCDWDTDPIQHEGYRYTYQWPQTNAALDEFIKRTEEGARFSDFISLTNETSEAEQPGTQLSTNEGSPDVHARDLANGLIEIGEFTRSAAEYGMQSSNSKSMDLMPDRTREEGLSSSGHNIPNSETLEED